jgi:hypothetical protein
LLKERRLCSIERLQSSSSLKHFVELSGAFQSNEIVAPADVMLANEDLRDGRSAVRTLDHELARLTTIIDGNLAILDALCLEQLLGSPAIWAKCLGVDFYGHDRSFTTDT